MLCLGSVRLQDFDFRVQGVGFRGVVFRIRCVGFCVEVASF